MAREPAVSAENVSRRFVVPHHRAYTVKQAVLGAIRRRGRDEFWALRDISFEVPAGQMLAVIGRNGSGKSTLLRIVGGIYRPTSGRVRTSGRVVGLLELGIGFQPDLSGRDNIYLNASLFGLTRRQVSERYDQIVEFAEIADFVDAPLRTYSTGMAARLAFAITTQIQADVLLVDEVLAVGDRQFTLKCIKHMKKLRNSGVTIFLVSHDLPRVTELCSRAIWLEQGALRMDGPAASVVNAYVRHYSAPRLATS